MMTQQIAAAGTTDRRIRVLLPDRGGALTGVVESVRAAMGRKTVFAKTALERRDLDTRDVLIALPAGTTLPIGLRVEVEMRSE